MIFGPVEALAFFGIIAIGLPHGAFDAAMAVALGRSGRSVSLPLFFTLYLAAAGAVIWLWLLFPVLSLGIFLAISLCHFGLGDRHAISDNTSHSPRFHRFLSALLIFCHGGLISIVLPYFHPAETAFLFSLISGDNASYISTIITYLFPVWAAAVMFYALLSFSLSALKRSLAELILLAAIMWVLPPLAGFALYFCCVHSARHFATLYNSLRPLMPAPQLIRTGMGLTVLSWAGFAMAYMVLTRSFGLGTETAVMQTVFIGLAALTVPHMILVDLMFRPEFKQEAAI